VQRAYTTGLLNHGKLGWPGIEATMASRRCITVKFATMHADGEPNRETRLLLFVVSTG